MRLSLILICLSLICPAMFSVIADPATVPTSQPLSRDELSSLFKSELGTEFKPDQLDQLIATHEQLERYFAANSTVERNEAIAQIRQIGLPLSTIGPICRVRANAPAMVGGVYYINEKIGPFNVHYFLGVPDKYTRLQPWPLVVRLPAARYFITQPKPDAEQVAQMYTRWILDELKLHPDALVLMPLLNLDDLYGPSYVGMNSVTKPILHAAGRANVDPSKIYLIGHAMSAHATWNLALHYPTLFAAINPLAGGASAEWQRLRMMNLRNVLPVIWHDSTDKVIKVDSSRQLTQILKRFKIDFSYDETKDIGNEPTPAILEKCYARLRAKSRELYPAQITLQSNRLDTAFNRIDWLQIYQPLNAGDDQKLLFRLGTGIMITQSTVWSADAKRNGNRFDIESKNVAVLRIYVNDQMIDMNEPVTVVVNKKIRFEGLVKPSLEELLQDQVFLGRGLRYFTGVIDIDLSERKPTTAPATQPGK